MQVVVITSPANVPHEPQTVNQLFHAGLKTLHLRKPAADLQCCRQYLQQIEPQFLSRVVLHQHHALANEFPIKGIHFKERDRPAPPLARMKPGLSQSTSFHTISDLLLDWQNLDYAFLSPVFDSISKEGYSAAGFDRSQLSQALRAAHMPVFALGGITPSRITGVRDMGFAGVGVLGSVWARDNPVDGLREFLDLCNEGQHC